MAYALHRVENLPSPFDVVHEQIVLMPLCAGEGGAIQPANVVQNGVRKLIFVLAGEARHVVPGVRGRFADVRLHSGDILSVPLLGEHRYIGLDAKQATRLHVVRLAFDAAVLPPVSRETSVRTPPLLPALSDAADDSTLVDFSTGALNHMVGGQDAAMQELLIALREEARLQQVGYRLRVHGLCLSLLVLFARKVLTQTTRLKTIGEDGDSSVPTRIGERADYHAAVVKEFLRHNHAHPDVTLAQIARHADLSEEHVARLFKRSSGTTIFEYLGRLRLNAARSELAATNHNIGEIARCCGFSSLAVFTRTFRRETGLTPTDYRKQIAQEIG